ncbi:MAG: isopenicillin N synthase family oxygenase, partial [Microcoleus sp. SIO2G3]|nr:isopenicillin N synthase family oxygenase [Microcoleus sp. SIO2G3]
MSTSLTNIPIIDFEPFIQGNITQQQAIAQQIYQACHEIGFMYLKNLGISVTLIDKIFTQTKQFFDLPLTVKNQLAWSDEISNRGYVGLERERLAPDKPGDLKEAFNVGKEVDSAERHLDDKSSLILNQWPTEQDNFRQIVLEFYQACTEAANQICQAFAIALHLPESFFLDRHTHHNHTLRLLHYPPLDQAPKLGQIRAGEHSDYGR